MYVCRCCGAVFAAPLPRHPWRVRRVSPVYGDAATPCCPACGEESFCEAPPEGGGDAGLV